MNKQNLPETSHSANVAMTYEMRKQHHGKIILALKEIGSGNYEQIANFLGMDRHQVGRRLSELEREGIVWKPGLKSNTKSGRQAFIYQLTGQSQPKTETEVNYAKLGKSATNYANDLIRSAQNHGAVQTDLFPEYQKVLRNERLPVRPPA